MAFDQEGHVSSHRMSNTTLRHFAAFLAREASDPSVMDASVLFAQLQTSTDMQHRCYRSEPTTVRRPSHPSATALPASPKINLTSLPAELIGLLRSHLDPADLVCLARTCRALDRVLDYRLADLGVLAFACEPAALVHDRGVRAALARQRYDATARLDRDRLAVLTDTDVEGVCRVCVRRHPWSDFARSAWTKQSHERTCRAAEARVRVCDHWTEDLVSLRARRRRVQCGGRTRAWWEMCEHPSHRSDVIIHDIDGGGLQFEAPCMLEFGDALVVARTMILIRADRPWESIGRDALFESLRRRTHIHMCPHSKLDEGTIARSFSQVPQALKLDFGHEDYGTLSVLPECDITPCGKCGCHWSVEVKTSRSGTTVRLNVDWQLPITKDPWDEHYLRNTEETFEHMRAAGS